MGKRLSKIYTRTGDDGTTGLGDGTRVAKDSLRVEAFGTVDEANSSIGVVLATKTVPQDIRDILTDVQHDLFVVRRDRLVVVVDRGELDIDIQDFRRIVRLGRKRLHVELLHLLLAGLLLRALLLQYVQLLPELRKSFNPTTTRLRRGSRLST